MKVFGKLGRRDDPKFFNTRNNKETEKFVAGKKPEEETMGQVLTLLKNMNPLAFNANKTNFSEKGPMTNNHFKRHPRMHNYPYATQWKEGKCIPNSSQGPKEKGTQYPLQINLVNMTDNVSWCIVCQAPHFLDYCALAQSFATNQQAQCEEGEEEKKDHDNVGYKMVNLCHDGEESNLEEPKNDVRSQRSVYQSYHQQVLSDNEGYDEEKLCATSSSVDHINIRQPSREEIEKITIEMISQVHSNYNLKNRTVNSDTSKPSGIFIKDITHKMTNDSKKVLVNRLSF